MQAFARKCPCTGKNGSVRKIFDVSPRNPRMVLLRNRPTLIRKQARRSNGKLDRLFLNSTAKSQAVAKLSRNWFDLRIRRNLIFPPRITPKTRFPKIPKPRMPFSLQTLASTSSIFPSRMKMLSNSINFNLKLTFPKIRNFQSYGK